MRLQCETWVQYLGWEDPLEEGMAAHSSILAWRILWTEEPGGYGPSGGTESDTAERLSIQHSLCSVFMFDLIFIIAL